MTGISRVSRNVHRRTPSQSPLAVWPTYASTIKLHAGTDAVEAETPSDVRSAVESLIPVSLRVILGAN